jgi:hypothetical protein
MDKIEVFNAHDSQLKVNKRVVIKKSKLFAKRSIEV